MESKPNRTLPADGYPKARAFLLHAARPLDRALFRFRFEAGTVEEVVDALDAFQNPDGGFGNAIEPDVRLPASSAFATSVGFQTLRALGLRHDHPMVRAALGYLVEHYDAKLGGWRALPVEANDHPHAPWWTQRDSPSPSPENWGNPNAEILGYLFEHADAVRSTLISEVSGIALRRLDEAAVPLGGYAILCHLRACAFAPADWRARVLARVRADAGRLFDPDPRQWGVDLQPFWLVPTPESALAEVLRDAVAISLDREIERQSDDGSWPPRWSWGVDPLAWEVAKRDWTGEQTLRTLEALAEHARLTGR